MKYTLSIIKIFFKFTNKYNFKVILLLINLNFMKFIYSLAIITLFYFNSYSQISTDGLIGYWPLNGNAKDSSGNNFNGELNNIIPTTNRFGKPNSACYFNGVNSTFVFPNESELKPLLPASFSFWIKFDEFSGFSYYIFSNCFSENTYTGIHMTLSASKKMELSIGGGVPNTTNSSNRRSKTGNTVIEENKWYFVSAVVRGPQDMDIFINGKNDGGTYSGTGGSLSYNNNPGVIGKFKTYGGDPVYFKGSLDNFKMFNIALTEQNVTDLFNECELSVKISETENRVLPNNNIKLTAQAYYPSVSYQWQSNPANFGWINIPLNKFYELDSINILNIKNVQLNNHNQSFRVIATSGSCKDTSETAKIIVLDSCIATVTDTLIINAIIVNTGNINTDVLIKVYPNPAYEYLIVDFGKYELLGDYSLKILNSLGATIFSTQISQQITYIDLNNWTGKGLYFVHLTDLRNQIIDTKKIIIK